MINRKLTLFSAIQPSGQLTLGNYIGTMRHWSQMQNDYKCFYCVADLHALTSLTKTTSLNKTTLDTLALYLSCGVNPEKSIVFVQSHVYQHSQLNWILNCFTQFGELFRMTQFKNKRIENCNNKQKTNIGLFNYPILMASDILLYQTDLVAIGLDQKQHLELTRDIAHRFNTLYGAVFTIPTPLINKFGSKIKSLLDPNKKMSKSDRNQNNVIFLLENISSVINKINNSITDSDKSHKICYDKDTKPGISNLLEILSVFSKKTIDDLVLELEGTMYSEFKKIVSDYVSKFLLNFQERYTHYRCNESYLEKIAHEGSIKAEYTSQITLQQVYSKLELLHRIK